MEETTASYCTLMNRYVIKSLVNLPLQLVPSVITFHLLLPLLLSSPFFFCLCFVYCFFFFFLFFIFFFLFFFVFFNFCFFFSLCFVFFFFFLHSFASDDYKSVNNQFFNHIIQSMIINIQRGTVKIKS